MEQTYKALIVIIVLGGMVGSIVYLQSIGHIMTPEEHVKSLHERMEYMTCPQLLDWAFSTDMVMLAPGAVKEMNSPEHEYAMLMAQEKCDIDLGVIVPEPEPTMDELYEEWKQ